MKKFLIILITLAMCTAAFALAGCEDEKDTDSGNQTEQGGGTEDGVFFLYTFSDGVWTKTQQNGDPLKGLCGEITAFQSMYGKLEYDSAYHTYKGDNITSTELAIENAAVTISFADGKIAGFSVDTKDETSTMQIRGSIEYESKEIVLPAIEEQ